MKSAADIRRLRLLGVAQTLERWAQFVRPENQQTFSIADLNAMSLSFLAAQVRAVAESEPHTPVQLEVV